jgi:hypothetical protein
MVWNESRHQWRFSTGRTPPVLLQCCFVSNAVWWLRTLQNTYSSELRYRALLSEGSLPRLEVTRANEAHMGA